MRKAVYLDEVMDLVDAYVLGFETHTRLVDAINKLVPVYATTEKEKRKTSSNDELKILPKESK